MTSPPFIFPHGVSEVYTATQLGIIVASLILMGMTITAYRNTNEKKLKYVVSAFGLFAFLTIVNLIDSQIVDIMPDEIRYTLISASILGILILLFLGIVKK